MGSRKRECRRLVYEVVQQIPEPLVFSKAQEYSPSEAAKVYEKALSSRKNVPMFNPLAALDGGRRRDGQLDHDRQSIQSHFNLAARICNVSAEFVVYSCLFDPSGFSFNNKF